MHARAKSPCWGCVCLTFNLRGHVETRPLYETVSRELNLRDVMAAYDRLASRRHVDSSAIAVVGSSYGGYLASILTSLRAVKWLGPRAPALYIDTGRETPKLQLHTTQNLKTYRHQLVQALDNKALKACTQAADHGLTSESDRRAYTTLLVNWLTEMLFGTRAEKVSVPAQSAGTAALPETPPKTI